MMTLFPGATLLSIATLLAVFGVGGLILTLASCGRDRFFDPNHGRKRFSVHPRQRVADVVHLSERRERRRQEVMQSVGEIGTRE